MLVVRLLKCNSKYTADMLEMLLCEQALYLTKRQKLTLDQFKALVDDKLNVTKLTMPVYDSRENTVGKGKNAGYQHFLFFFTIHSKALSFRDVGIVL